MNRMLLASLFALAACGGEKAAPANAGSAPVEAAPEAATNIPGDADSKAFAKRLLALEVKDFKASDGAGASFVYTLFKFNPDNTWTADGYVEMDFERMECRESGTWTMDAASSASSADVNWTVAKTNCAGRDAGQETRALVTISDKGEPSFAFR